MQKNLLRNTLTVTSIALLLLAGLLGIASRSVTPAHAENNGVATTPFMGWSTWSFDGGYPTQANMETQANVVASKLKSYGYNYILLDDHYYLNPGTTVDQYGRWVVNSAQFPNGNGYYSLVNQSSGLYADVNGASTANGAKVIQWSGPGGTNQQWSFVQG